MIKEKSIEARLKLDDLIFIKKLGSGQFGSVYLVKHRDKKLFYGLKTIAKYQILDQNLEKHLEVDIYIYINKYALYMYVYKSKRKGF